VPDRVSSSRLELRLAGEIAGAPTALEADCKHAELAAYRTRLGRVEEAKSTLGALHRRYDSSPHVAISAWLNLVEGLVAHFGDMDPSARDKVMRSHALSTAAGLTPMRALSAAWLAHLDYLHVDVMSMTRHVAEALQLSDGNHHGARSRAHLVVAQAHHLAGYLDRALPWYSRAREHALADGDDATVSALMHNMAWLRAHALRQRAFLAMGPGDVTMHALMGAESTGNFDFLIGSESLHSR
jgi:ATP/maltotriose-dependent transcriptional regulator MalT